MRFRVLSWNIHKGIGGVDRRYQPERIVEVIAREEPDVALLQEVAHAMPRARNHDMALLLAEELRMPHVAFHPQHRFQVGGYGNAILSRWPLSDVHELDLTIGTRKKRGLMQARAHPHVDGHSRTVVVHNLHLGLAGSERRLQLERFLACHPLQRLHCDTPVILGGDLNDLWGTLGPRVLEPAGFRRAGIPARTFPAVLPLRPLDALFVRGGVSVVSCHPVRTSLARAASDHLPVVAELQIPLPAVAQHAARGG